MKKKLETIKSTTTVAIFLICVADVLMGAVGVANGQFAVKPEKWSNVTALYILGDSSVDCGDNTLFYSFLHRNLSLHPCNGSDSSLLPQLLAVKMGLPHTPLFYSQNGSIEGLLRGVNFGSAEATIMNPSSSQSHQSLNQQLRQVFDTFQLLQLQFGEERTRHFIESSIFYLSFGKDDYIDLFLRNSSGVMLKYSGQEFAQMLVNQMIHVLRSLQEANVRKIVCMGILPLGCTPRTMWEWHNWTTGDDYGFACVEEINELVLEYNTMLEEHIVNLNTELADVEIIFCDVYQGIMEIITNPTHYGFKDVQTACCGLGMYGGMIGCLSMENACDQASTYVWWDLYNPTKAVNSLLAKSAWSGQSLTGICRPINVRDLVSTSGLHLA